MEPKVQNLFKKWERYFNGKEDYQLGENLPIHSIRRNIQLMVNDDFVFRTFNSVGLESSKDKEKYNKLFCSNGHLRNALTDWYYITQTLYIRRLTEDSTKEGKKETDDWKKTCSLVNLLTNIEKNSCHINRKSFCEFRGSNNCSDIKFDKISEKDETCRKDGDKISKEYLASLKDRLKTEEIRNVRIYSDQVVAHSDFINLSNSFGMDTIKKCHETIISVYQEIEFIFFTESFFGETTLSKDSVLQKSDRPFR